MAISIPANPSPSSAFHTPRTPFSPIHIFLSDKGKNTKTLTDRTKLDCESFALVAPDEVGSY